MSFSPEPLLPQWVYIARALSQVSWRWAVLGVAAWKIDPIHWPTVLETLGKLF